MESSGLTVVRSEVPGEDHFRWRGNVWWRRKLWWVVTSGVPSLVERLSEAQYSLTRDLARLLGGVYTQATPAGDRLGL